MMRRVICASLIIAEKSGLSPTKFPAVLTSRKSEMASAYLTLNQIAGAPTAPVVSFRTGTVIELCRGGDAYKRRSAAVACWRAGLGSQVSDSSSVPWGTYSSPT